MIQNILIASSIQIAYWITLVYIHYLKCFNLQKFVYFFGKSILIHFYSIDNQYYWKFFHVREHIFYFYYISLGYLS